MTGYLPSTQACRFSSLLGKREWYAVLTNTETLGKTLGLWGSPTEDDCFRTDPIFAQDLSGCSKLNVLDGSHLVPRMETIRGASDQMCVVLVEL
jgi:hypothetical protein